MNAAGANCCCAAESAAPPTLSSTRRLPFRSIARSGWLSIAASASHGSTGCGTISANARWFALAWY
jgi:hypothetical protein